MCISWTMLKFPSNSILLCNLSVAVISLSCVCEMFTPYAIYSMLASKASVKRAAYGMLEIASLFHVYHMSVKIGSVWLTTY